MEKLDNIEYNEPIILPDKPEIAVCMCSLDNINMVFMERSWNQLWNGKEPDYDKFIQVQRGSTSVAQKRNSMITKALERKNVTHIFMIDNDVLYEDNNGNIDIAIRYMKAVMDSLPDAGVVAGMMRVRGLNCGQMFPCMAYEFLPNVNNGKGGWKPLPYKKFKNRNGIVEVDGIGNGFTLIKREVFEKMEKPYFLEDKWTEDFYFDLKAKELGYHIYVINDIRLSHISTLKIMYDGSIKMVDQFS